MTRRSLSIGCTASLGVYLVGYGVFLASFALANWVKFPAEDPVHSYSYGLWWNCSCFVTDGDGGCDGVCLPYEISSLSSEWIAAQAFYIIAVILGFVAGTIYAKLPVNAVFQIISGAGTLIAVIIFGAAVSLAPGEELDYAFYLGPVAGVLLLGNGLFLAVSVGREGCTMDDVMPPERGQTKTV